MHSRLLFSRRWVVPTIVILLCGCDQGVSKEEHEILRHGLQSDERVAAVLQQVDQLALQGKPQDASLLLNREARPASQQSVAWVKNRSVRSSWGKARWLELQALTADRASSLDRYDAALKSEMIERVVTALEEQKSLEQRGNTLAQAISQVPSR